MSKYYSKSVGGFVDPAIMGQAMPADAVKVTDAQYQNLMSSQKGGGIMHDQDGVLYAPDPSDNLTLEQIKQRKVDEIGYAMSSRIAAIKSGYPQDEVLSWPEQKSEAVAYQQDNSVTTPLLSSMAEARGITLNDLVSRVLANAAAWSTLSGKLIGKRQAYESQIQAAQDIYSVSAITWVD